MKITKLYVEEQGFIGISFSEDLNNYVLHVTLKNWSLSEYKRYKKIFGVIKEELKKLTPVVFSLCKTDKELKFNKVFGFKDTGLKAFILDDGRFYSVAKLEL